MLESIMATTRVSPFYAFEQSDNFGRFIVFLLFCASIVAWTIMVDKYVSLRQTRLECQEVSDRMASGQTYEFLGGLDGLSGPMAGIGLTARQALADVLGTEVHAIEAAGSSQGLRDGQLRRVRSMTETQVDREIIEIESRLGVLSSIVSASPFLGLLGTVWGVMMAFSGMAMEGEADINAIAPGVSGALLTTVVGLLVAIPAVIGYNILVNQVKEMTVALDNFAENLLSRVEADIKEGPQT